MEKGFFEKVYDLVRQIPYGKVTSYGAIAAFLGSKGSARMVGWALNNSKNIPENLPAHRVVNRSGLLTAKRHFGGGNTLVELLESEGVIIVDDKISNFNEVFWDPSDNC